MNEVKTNYPSTESRDNLNRLSEEFKPDDVKFLLTLNSNISIEECRDNAMETIQVLKNYVDNNHSINTLNKTSGLSLLSVRSNQI